MAVRVEKKYFVENVLLLLESSKCQELHSYLNTKWHDPEILDWADWSRETGGDSGQWSRFYDQLWSAYGTSPYLQHVIDAMLLSFYLTEKHRSEIRAMILSTQSDRVMAVHVLRYMIKDESDLKEPAYEN